ncbi:MAG TPA: tagaturonate reductase [Chitinophagaceae bacterium]|nr:tagaturonate reductase [Chitinophagaceae bacterium]
MHLSKETITRISDKDISLPSKGIFSLPEKVLQFGTGVLLRGLCDYFIDKANRQNIFNGRIVVVKSTGKGDTDAFALQDGLYTHVVKGIENGNIIEEKIINASISRVLSANNQWPAVLACAAQKSMQIIISNTTEVGITYKGENILSGPPASFPGKLLAWLYERYRVFSGSVDAGMIIIPTELVTENAKKLKDILLQLSLFNQLDEKFVRWLQTANHFCCSLVDRIVPGKIAIDEEKDGYTDDIAVMSEAYRLWAIETSDEHDTKELSFARSDSGVILAADIYKYRELKLRLLNGTHTLSCGLAVLAGFTTVKDAMADFNFKKFVTHVMLDEIAKAIIDEQINYDEAKSFGEKVIDRFSNPFIEHQWLSITLQYTSKMMMRNIPVLQKHYQKNNSVPDLIAIGFAAYILFMKSRRNEKGNFTGTANNTDYPITDDKAAILYEYWQQDKVDAVVQNIFADKSLWNDDLNQYPGFGEAVTRNVKFIIKNGASRLIQTI